MAKSAKKVQLKSAQKAQLTLLDQLNVFDKDYQKPELSGHWVANPDREGESMWISKSAKKVQLKSAQKAKLTILDQLNVFDKDYQKPKLGHWVANPDREGEAMWINGEEYAQGGYQKIGSHKPRVVSPGPSLVSAFGIDSNIYASNYQAPKAWTHGDHIEVAMVHADGKEPAQSRAKGPTADANPCGVHSVGAVCNPF